MKAPEAMGVERRRELENMKDSHTYSSDFTHEVVAVASDGDILYETESLYPFEVNKALESYPSGDDAPEGVDHFEVIEK